MNLILFCFNPTDILGNAYISMFFTSGQNPQLSQQALSAYAQAVSICLIYHLIIKMVVDIIITFDFYLSIFTGEN